MTPDSCIVPLSTKVINLTYLFFVINSYLFLLKHRVFFPPARPPHKKKILNILAPPLSLWKQFLRAI